MELDWSVTYQVLNTFGHEVLRLAFTGLELAVLFLLPYWVVVYLELLPAKSAANVAAGFTALLYALLPDMIDVFVLDDAMVLCCALGVWLLRPTDGLKRKQSPPSILIEAI